MTKTIFKTLSIVFLFLIIIIFYLSYFGIKTDKFNNRINKKILEINNRVNLELDNVNFLLNPYNFTINVVATNPKIYLGKNKLVLDKFKTNISLKALLNSQFLIDDLQISTKKSEIKDVILLIRSFKNSTELFVLNRLIKSGSMTANISLNFDDEGRIKDDYQINGLVKQSEVNFLNQFKLRNLNFNFDIRKNRFFLTEIKTDLNNIKLISSLIDINKKNNLFLVKGSITSNKKDFDKKQLDILAKTLFENLDIEKIRFSSINDFSFNISKKLKLSNLNIESRVTLNQLDIKKNILNLKSYFPAFDNKFKFTNHEIKINFNKDKLDIVGKGEVSIADKSDSLTYKIERKNDEFIFHTNIGLKNKKLLIKFLDFKKKEGLESSILIKGNFKKNDAIKFNLISFEEKNNKIFTTNLYLNKNLKITNIDTFNMRYLNNKKIKNQLILKKINSDYTITGESFDATKLINKIMLNTEESYSLFNNLNSKIDVKIDKTFIDDVNFINNLSGTLIFTNNKIDNLDLKSIFPNNKKINLSIKTNAKQEKVTKLLTDYPKPLIKRYDFIKGFEEGFLVYHSVKKDEISNTLLTIQNFKVNEVPVFAKLLSLASLQGIADLLTGDGIRFTDLEMKFSNKKGLTTIEEMFATGPAVSILMEGYIESNKLISLRGTLVPATTINKYIASIPILGDILIGQKTGEGVFGVSFKIKGGPKNLETTVNPIKTLTPRFISRTLKKLKNS